MKKLIYVVVALLICTALSAQWSTDAANPNLIYNLNDYQTCPQVRISNNGDVYTAWVQYDYALDNFNIMLQKMSEQGIAQWGAPVTVNSNPSTANVMFWDMICDNDGNAIIAYYSERNNARNIYVYKVSPSGQMLWDATGINVSNDTVTNITNIYPTLICTTTNNIVVAWQRQAAVTNVKVNSISPAGNLLWGDNGFAIQVDNGSTSDPKFIPAPEGEVLLTYYGHIGTEQYPPRYAYIRKLSPAGTDVWAFHTVQLSSFSSGVWDCCSDNEGGALIALGANPNNDNYSDIYVQHVNSDGSLAYPADGVIVTSIINNANQYPLITYNPQTQEAYVMWGQTPVIPDNYWGLRIQKLNSTGTRQWGTDGIEYIPMGDKYIYPIDAMMFDDNFCIVYRIHVGELALDSAHIKAMRFDNAGQAVWQGNEGLIATTNSVKQMMSSDHNTNYTVVSWQDGDGPFYTYDMRLNRDGSLGYQPAANDDDTVPLQSLWLQTYPNPFPDNVTLQFKGINPDAASISVYNIKGQQVQQIRVSDFTAGQLNWDAKDQNGNSLSAGIYLIKLQQGNKQVINKVVKLK